MRYPVAAQFVGDDHPWHVPQSLQQLTKGGGLGVTPGLDEDVQDDTVLDNRPLRVASLPIDLDKHLVEVPLIPGASPRLADYSVAASSAVSMRATLCSASTSADACCWISCCCSLIASTRTAVRRE